MGKDLNGKDIGKGMTQRIDGTYMARFVDKNKKRQTIYDKDLKSLKKKLEKAKYESEHSIYGTGEIITLTDWFEQFLEIYKKGKVKEVTIFRIRQTYSSCKNSSIGMMKLKDVKAIHIQQLINRMYEKGNTYGTLSLLKSLLNEMFKKAIGNGLILINPCDAVVLPKKEKIERRFLTDEEQQLFLEVAKDYSHYDIFCLNLSLGARIGEILGLKWSDINFEEKTIHIQRTLHYARLNEEESCHFFFTSPKTETSDRCIPLFPETEEILKRVKRKQLRNKVRACWSQDEPFVDMVFTTQQGAPIRYGDVNRTIKTVITNVNVQEEEMAKLENREPKILESFSPHCFRHTFITRCKCNGVPYEIIKHFVGHSREEMTAYYDHYKPKVDYSQLMEISFVDVV